MMWGNHPFVGGRPFRALLLREFIRYAKSHGKSLVLRPREKLPNGIATTIATRKSKNGRTSRMPVGREKSRICRAVK